MSFYSIILSIFGTTLLFSQNKAPYVSEVWVADNGNGTYKNPIIYADYLDPDVVRVGEDYYMTAPNFSASTKISLYPEEAKKGKTAGLIIMGMDYATVSISHKEKGYYLLQTEAINAVKGTEETVNKKINLKSNSVFIKVDVKAPDALCRFLYSENGKSFKKIGKPFKAKEGKWIGAKVGLFRVSTIEAKRGGYVD